MIRSKLSRWILLLSVKQLLGLVILVIYILIALAAPILMTHDPWEINRSEQGLVVRLQPPSTNHLLGTTHMGRDVFSQLVIGTRATLLVGIIAAFCVSSVLRYLPLRPVHSSRQPRWLGPEIGELFIPRLLLIFSH